MKMRHAVMLTLLAACSGRGSDEVRGTIEMDQVDVAPQMAARVEQVLVNEGDRVRAGDTIAVLSVADADAQVAARRARVAQAQAAVRDLQAGARPQEIQKARAELQAAEAEARRTGTELERVQRLVRDSVVAQRELDNASAAARVAAERRDAAAESLRLLQAGARPAQVRAAQAELAQARADLEGTGSRLSDLVLVSPVAGVVLNRSAEPGEVLQPGMPAAIVGDTARLYVRAYVPERLLQRVAPGSTARIIPDGWERGAPATVQSISPTAEFTPRIALTEDERADLLFGIRLSLDSALPAGLWARVDFQPSDRP